MKTAGDALGGVSSQLWKTRDVNLKALTPSIRCEERGEDRFAVERH
jgi:hypothetical protein